MLLLAGACGDETFVPKPVHYPSCTPAADGSCVETLSDALGVVQLRLDGGRLFWASAPQDGYSAIMSVATSPDHPFVSAWAPRVGLIDVDAAYVYWVQIATMGNADGAVLRAPRTGGAVETVIDGLDQPQYLVVGEGVVCWTASAGLFCLLPDAGLPTQFANGAAAAFTIDSGFVYWLELTSPAVFARASAIGGSREPLTTESGLGVFGPLIRNGALYWGDAEAGRLRRMPLDTRVRADLASWQPLANQGSHGLAVNDHWAYWTTSDGAMRRVSSDGSTVETLMVSAQSSNGIVMDDHGIYWASFVAGEIYALRLPGGP